MVELELEFDCALLASSGVAESLDAAGAEARAWPHAEADVDDCSPPSDGSE